MPDENHVLVTRTGAEGRALAHRLNQSGFHALHLPLVRLHGVTDTERVQREFATLPHLDGLILTSREGVRRAAELGFLTPLKAALAVVPGQGTRSLALELGLQRVCCPEPGSGNSEAMLAMPELLDVADSHWLILAASDGRRLLDRTLEARGARVHRLSVYRRGTESPGEAVLEVLSSKPDWTTLLASGSALDRLVNGLPSDLWAKLQSGTMIVPSARLRARAQELGVEKIILSRGASDEEMLKALRVSTSGP